MITRLYVNNFRCLVAFEAEFQSFGVLCGPNGAGKSSAFDAIRLVRNLATGNTFLGPGGIDALETTNWLVGNPVQEFELKLNVEDREFEYLIHIEQTGSELHPRIIKEWAACNKQELFSRDLDGVHFQRADGTSTGFPLDWRQAALGAFQPAGNRRDIEILQQALSQMLILRPNPRSMKGESKAEVDQPDLGLENLTSWYRSLSQDQDWINELRDSLQEVWPDFRSFKLENVGMNAKALQLRFGGIAAKEAGSIFYEKLSDGEKALVALYMIRAALETGAAKIVFIDEPDNYVGLPELQPWIMSMQELLDENHQTVLISHHPEILDSAGEEFGRYLWRDNHTSPTRIGPLKTPNGLTPGEAVTRGWIGGA